MEPVDDPAAKRQRQDKGLPSGCATVPKPQAASGPPYIGVGLEMYCAVEPCLMCSMALVHSRIARVVYARPQPVRDTALRAPLGTVLTRACKHALHCMYANFKRGGLGTAARLQSVQSLNHRLEVFRYHPEAA